MKIFFLMTVFWLSNAHAELTPFVAQYQVKRGGKVVAEQSTTLSRNSEGYVLYDQTIATKGMASWIGFQRQERSEFQIAPDTSLFEANKHQMKQDASISHREYQFDRLNDHQFKVLHKKENTTVSADQPIIATHMMPLQIGLLACQGKRQINLNILKNKRIKTYHFSVTIEHNGLLKVSRNYPKDSKRKTTSWLDPKQNCLTTQTRHQNDDEPLIETTLKSFSSSQESIGSL